MRKRWVSLRNCSSRRIWARRRRPESSRPSRKKRLDKEISPEEIKEALAHEIAQILEPVAQPLAIHKSHKPHVVLVVGVNGNGKTTTIGKLAHNLKAAGP